MAGFSECGGIPFGAAARRHFMGFSQHIHNAEDTTEAHFTAVTQRRQSASKRKGRGRTFEKKVAVFLGLICLFCFFFFSFFVLHLTLLFIYFQPARQLANAPLDSWQRRRLQKASLSIFGPIRNFKCHRFFVFLWVFVFFFPPKYSAQE